MPRTARQLQCAKPRNEEGIRSVEAMANANLTKLGPACRPQKDRAGRRDKVKEKGQLHPSQKRRPS